MVESESNVVRSGIVFNVVVLPFRFRNSQSKAASTFRFNVTVFEATVAFLRQCHIQPQPPNHVQNSSLKLFIQTRLIELHYRRHNSGSESRALQIGPCSHERVPLFSRSVHNFWVIAFICCFNSWTIFWFFLFIFEDFFRAMNYNNCGFV